MHVNPYEPPETSPPPKPEDTEKTSLAFRWGMTVTFAAGIAFSLVASVLAPELERLFGEEAYRNFALPVVWTLALLAGTAVGIAKGYED